MGNAAIIIRSVGPHQNARSFDAEQIAMRAVAELRSYGHSVLSASVETGGCSLDVSTGTSVVSDPEEPARAAYERYLYSSGGKSLVSGAELPAFDALSPEIKKAWMAAADHSQQRLVR